MRNEDWPFRATAFQLVVFSIAPFFHRYQGYLCFCFWASGFRIWGFLPRAPPELPDFMLSACQLVASGRVGLSTPGPELPKESGLLGAGAPCYSSEPSEPVTAMISTRMVQVDIEPLKDP